MKPNPTTYKKGPELDHGPGSGAVSVSWAQLVTRLVAFLTAHNFDADEGPVIRAIGVLRAHVLKARSDEATAKVTRHESACKTVTRLLDSP